MTFLEPTTEVAFTNTQLGEVSDVEDLTADLSSVPTVEDYEGISETKFDSDTYETGPIEDLYETETANDDTQEDVW